MSNLKQYKCPSCGGPINYDVTSGNLGVHIVIQNLKLNLARI